MFGTAEGAVDQALERRRAARVREVLEHRAEDARRAHRMTQIVREAEDDGDPQAAGCSSGAQWLAQISNCDYRTAERITRTSDALRELPALDEAFSEGDLTLDQVAAAAPIATPESDAQIARIAIGKAPSQIAREARKIVPPKVADDRELYQRRALRMTWTDDGRELVFSGRLPLEQGLVVEKAIRDVAKRQRATDKHAGTILEWQQSTADALVSIVGQGGGADDDGLRRSPTTLIVHLSDDAPPMLEGAGPISVETAERLTCDARRLTIKLSGRDLVHSRVGRCASYPQQRALRNRSEHCQYPGCTNARELEAHHVIAVEHGGATECVNLLLVCSRHHKHLHDHHIRTSGNADNPIFEDQSGRAITAHQPHAPPR